MDKSKCGFLIFITRIVLYMYNCQENQVHHSPPFGWNSLIWRGCSWSM